MSLYDRIKVESHQIDPATFHQKNCFTCQYWIYKVRKESRYCHKCINNLNISIGKEQTGYNIAGLHDYYKSVFARENKEALSEYSILSRDV